MHISVLFKYIIPVSLIIFLAYLNYVASSTDIYVCDIPSNNTYPAPPPFKYVYRISIYDPSEKIDIVEYNGLLIGGSVRGGVKAVNIKGYGPDVYLLISSIVVIIIYYATIRIVGYAFNKIGLIILGLVFSAIILNTIYFIESQETISKGMVYEANNPLICETIGSTHVCVLDGFAGEAIVYVKVNRSITLLVLNENRVSSYDVGNEFTSYMRGRDIKIGYNYSGGDLSITYRRIKFDYLRDPYIRIYILNASIVLQTASIILVCLDWRKKKSG